jgi:hypothetical protein
LLYLRGEEDNNFIINMEDNNKFTHDVASVPKKDSSFAQNVYGYANRIINPIIQEASGDQEVNHQVLFNKAKKKERHMFTLAKNNKPICAMEYTDGTNPTLLLW